MANTYKNILKYGSYQNYLDLQSKDADVLYFCTDNGKLFKGSVDFSDRFVVCTAATLPATGVPGNVYYVSDENKFKTYLKVGGTSSYVEIGNPIDKIGTSTTSTITNTSADDHVPSTKNVYKYGQEILAQAIGGSSTVKNVSADSTNDGKIVLTYGDDSTTEVTVNGAIISVAASASTSAAIDILAADDATSTAVVVPGVLTGAAAGTNAGEISITNSTAADSTTIVVPGVVATVADKTTADATFTVTPTTGTAYDVTVTGVVTTPTWNGTTRTLILPVAGGSSVTVDIGKDIFVQEGYYDTTNKNIVLILNNDDPADPQHPIIIPASALVDVYTGGATTSASVTVSTSNVITAAVKIDTSLDTTTDVNAITVVDDTNGGLRVSLAPVYEEIAALAGATAVWGTF